MSDYRRLYVPGGTYFFTVVTYERQRLFVTAHRVKELRQAFRYVKARRPFAVIAAVGLCRERPAALSPAYDGEITCVRMYAAWNCPHWGRPRGRPE